MPGESLPKLVEIMSRLRSPEGCPWDREQSHDSLKPYLIEEAYEVLEAIEKQDHRAVQEELGDLLLQVVFHAQLAHEAGRFNLDQVIEGICEKLIRRHPHVFAGIDLKTSGEVLANWKKIKATEKGTDLAAKPHSILDGLPHHMPPLTAAHQISLRAAAVGFDWPSVAAIFDKLNEEIIELKEAIQAGESVRIREEIGDLLFVIVNLARRLHSDPNLALQSTNKKFQNRFQSMEQILQGRGENLKDMSLEEMDQLWESVKAGEPKNG